VSNPKVGRPEADFPFLIQANFRMDDDPSSVSVGGLHVLGAEPDSDESCAHAARERRSFQLPQCPRGPRSLRLIQTTPDLLLDDRLHALRKACGKGASALYFREMVDTQSTFGEGLCQYVSGTDGILNGQIDTDAPDR
jgi:hypothetical protein